MHLIEKYSLEIGVKIGKPELYEKFYPVPISGKYITQYVEQGIQSMQYEYWEDVIELMNPYLKQNDIKILNLNPSAVKSLDNLFRIEEKIDSGQLSYILKNSLLHFGETSFATDVAVIHNINLVALYSMSHKECLEPYWGNRSKQILLEPPAGYKPSYAPVEASKSINSITPEKIAGSILFLLGLDYKFDYETVFVGSLYTNKQVEVIPENIADIDFYPISIRMDYHFDERNLVEQFSTSDKPINIITNKAISEDTLLKIRKRVECIYYIIEDDEDPSFIEKAKRMKIPFKLMSYMEESKIKDKKLKYMDLAPIFKQKTADPKEIKELKDEDLDSLYYFSNKRVLNKGKIYLSKAGYDAGLIHKSQESPQKLINSEAFWRELDCFKIVKKAS
jgi:hypothetical protein